MWEEHDITFDIIHRHIYMHRGDIEKKENKKTKSKNENGHKNTPHDVGP